MYHCPNPSCGETWETNDKGMLIPEFHFKRDRLDEGWLPKKAEFKVDCPQCSNDWLWSDYKVTSGLNHALERVDFFGLQNCQ